MLNEHSLTILFIIFGAIAHVAVMMKDARAKKERFTKVDMFISFSISMFSGMIFTLASLGFGATGVAIGLAGSMGAFLGLAALNKYGDSLLETVTGTKGNDKL